MRRIPSCLLLLSFLSASHTTEAAPGDWPYYRHDRQLTARSSARGNLTEAPVIKWKYYLGGWHNRFSITYAEGERVSILIPKPTDPPSNVIWDGIPPIDLVGDGKL